MLRKRLPLVVLALGLLVDAVVLALDARRLWFFGDDWEILVRRGLGHDALDHLLQPHNGHLIALPVIVFRTLLSLVGTGSYLPYAALAIAAHLVTAAGTYLALRSVRCPEWGAVVGALAVAFLAGGAGAENTLWDFQVSFLGSTAFGVAALALSARGGVRWRLLAGVALVLSLGCSGIGLIMTVWVVLTVLIARGLVPALSVAATPALVYGAWRLAYGQPGSQGSAGLGDALWVAVRGLGDLWSSVLHLPHVGWVVLLVLVATACRPGTDREPRAAAIAGLVALAAFFVLVGLARSGPKDAVVGASRYLYVGVLLCAPAMVLLGSSVMDLLRRRPRGRVALVGGMLVAGTLVAVTAVGLVDLQRFAHGRTAVVGQQRAAIAAGLRLAASREPLLSDALSPRWDAGLTVRAATELGLDRVLASAPLDSRARLGARNDLQVAVSPASLSLPSVASVDARGVTGLGGPLSGCATGTARSGGTISFESGTTGAQLRVTAPGGEIATQVMRGRGRSSWSLHVVGRGSSAWVGIVAPTVTLRVRLAAGPVTICPA